MRETTLNRDAKSSLRLVRYRLEDGIRDVMEKELAERVAMTVLESDENEAILANIGAHVLGSHLPGQVLRALQVFSANGHHALTLGNLPRQQFPPTPVNGYGDEPSLAIVNAVHFGIIQLLGATPFAVNYENRGRLMRNVVPNPAAEGTTSSWGADSEFFWHSDNPHLPFGTAGRDPRPFVPRYLTFYAVRNEERVPTETAAGEDVVNRLPPQTLSRLERREFAVGAPDSNDFDAAPQVLDDAALLEADDAGYHWMRYDRGTTRGLTREAADALETLSTTLEGVPSEQFMLRGGDFLIFDNYRVLHRRRAFTPNPPSTARWLRRCYAS